MCVYFVILQNYYSVEQIQFNRWDIVSVITTVSTYLSYGMH
jgi:hypothetical protein